MTVLTSAHTFKGVKSKEYLYLMKKICQVEYIVLISLGGGNVGALALNSSIFFPHRGEYFARVTNGIVRMHGYVNIQNCRFSVMHHYPLSGVKEQRNVGKGRNARIP